MNSANSLWVEEICPQMERSWLIADWKLIGSNTSDFESKEELFEQMITTGDGDSGCWYSTTSLVLLVVFGKSVVPRTSGWMMGIPTPNHMSN